CEQRKVCSETGLDPSEHCEKVVMDYFIPLISPTKTCDNWKEVAISADEKTSYCKSCLPESGYKKKWFQLIDPEMQNWMEENRLSYTRIPAHNADCETIFKEGKPSITSPLAGTEYLIDKKSPEPIQL